MSYSTSTQPSRDQQQDASTETAPIRLTSSHSSSTSELASLKIRLKQSIRQFLDFPTKGILFEDILPLFADPDLHQSLIRALELHVRTYHADDQKPEIIVGLEARGFLFGPSLALALGAGFVPIRKKGKLPGPTETATYEKEYGKDLFEIQKEAIKQGQRVLIVDDIIATGMPLYEAPYCTTWPTPETNLIHFKQVDLLQLLVLWSVRSVEPFSATSFCLNSTFSMGGRSSMLRYTHYSPVKRVRRQSPLDPGQPYRAITL